MSIFLCCKHGIPHLLAGGGGSVINASSVTASRVGRVADRLHRLQGGGARTDARDRVEFARRGHARQRAVPRSGATPMLAVCSAPTGGSATGAYPGGTVRRADEVAEAAAFLAGEPSYITGTDFLVDGGITAAYLRRPAKSEPELTHLDNDGHIRYGGPPRRPLARIRDVR